MGETTSKYFGTTAISRGATGQFEKLNTMIIKKGENIPCSVSKIFYTTHDGQEYVDCDVTESGAAETDPNFVKTIWTGELELPKGRPAGQEIEVTYGYDENQIMNCSFVDVETGKEKVVDLGMEAKDGGGSLDIEEFFVE